MVRLYYALSALGLIGAANAHTEVFGIWVNDVFQGDGRTTYVRSPPTNGPVKDVTLKDIICNTNNVEVPDSVHVAAGDKVTFEWYSAIRGDSLTEGHKGPITVYIAPQSSNGVGGVWTKLWESGLTAGVWATDTLVKNGGKHDLTLPTGLVAGDYLLRAEIIALHEADTDYTTNHNRGAQFYPSCSQFKVSGGGSLTPPGTFNFIGGYTHNDPGILYDLYNPNVYPIPGPAVWDGKSGGSNTNPTPATTPATTPTKAPATTPRTTPTTAPTKTPATTSRTTPPTTPITSPTKIPPTTPTPTPTDYPAYYAPDSAPAASPTPTSTPPCSTTGGAGDIVPKYHQCGGKMYTGSTVCADGTTCKLWSEFYSQCVEN